MKKENVVNKNKCFPGRLLSGVFRLYFRLVNKETTLLYQQRISGRSRIKCGMTPNFMGFTLIELLVVVLIIGILASVALPQYEKAVWKSRAANVRALQTGLATAQNAYFLANNTYPTSFSELDLDFDNLTAADSSTLHAQGLISDKDVVRYNKLFEVIIGENGNTTWFRTGKYKGCGLYVNYKTRKWYCWEWYSYYKGAAGGFCQKIMGAGDLSSEGNNVRSYPM